MINLQIKTPIWTGNIDVKGSLLQPTGIIGSLRWWTEAILRSEDKYICDPISDDRCPKEVGNQKHYCLACLIFGATGIRRLFRLNMNGGESVFDGPALNITPSNRRKGWYLGSGIVGRVNLKIIHLDKNFDEIFILTPLVLASKWGGIGAKTQHGYGVVEIENCPEIDFNKFKSAIEKITNQERLSKLKINLRYESSTGFPNLKEMFFAKVQFEVSDTEWWKGVDGIAERGQRSQKNYYKGYENDQKMIAWINSGSVPIAPAIKNWLRYGNGKNLWQTNNQNQDKRIENWLFGTIKNGRIASKINISCAYQINDNLWEFRIWGWIPENTSPSGFSRNDFLNKLKGALNGRGSTNFPWTHLLGSKTRNHTLKVWREFKSSRDTVKPNEANTNDYLQSLLRGEVAK